MGQQEVERATRPERAGERRHGGVALTNAEVGGVERSQDRILQSRDGRATGGCVTRGSSVGDERDHDVDGTIACEHVSHAPAELRIIHGAHGVTCEREDQKSHAEG